MPDLGWLGAWAGDLVSGVIGACSAHGVLGAYSVLGASGDCSVLGGWVTLVP